MPNNDDTAALYGETWYAHVTQRTYTVKLYEHVGRYLTTTIVTEGYYII